MNSALSVVSAKAWGANADADERRAEQCFY